MPRMPIDLLTRSLLLRMGTACRLPTRTSVLALAPSAVSGRFWGMPLGRGAAAGLGDLLQELEAGTATGAPSD